MDIKSNIIARMWTTFRDSTVVFTDSNNPQDCKLCMSNDQFVTHSHFSPRCQGGFSIETIRRFMLEDILADQPNQTLAPVRSDATVHDNVSVANTSHPIGRNFSRTSAIVQSTSTGVPINNSLTTEPVQDLQPTNSEVHKVSSVQNNTSIFSFGTPKNKIETQAPQTQDQILGNEVQYSNIALQTSKQLKHAKQSSKESEMSLKPKEIETFSKFTSETVPKVKPEIKNEVTVEKVVPKQVVENVSEPNETEVKTELSDTTKVIRIPKLKKLEPRLMQSDDDEEREFDGSTFDPLKVDYVKKAFDSFVNMHEESSSSGSDGNSWTESEVIHIDIESSKAALEERLEAGDNQDRYRFMEKIRCRMEAEEEDEKKRMELETKEQEIWNENKSVTTNIDDRINCTIEETEKSELYRDVNIPSVSFKQGEDVICYISNVSSNLNAPNNSVRFFINVLENRKLYHEIYEKFYDEIVESPNVFSHSVGEYFFCFMDQKYHRIQILSSSFILRVLLIDEGITMDIISDQYIFKEIIWEPLTIERIAPLAAEVCAVGFANDLDRMTEMIDLYCSNKTLIALIIQTYDEKDQSYVVSFDNIRQEIKSSDEGENEQFDVASEFYSR